MSNARERGEARPSGGQIGRSLSLVDRYAQRAATGRKPADNVTIYPRNTWLCGKHASVTAFHGRFVSRMLYPQT
jgi:hypothetical protein